MAGAYDLLGKRIALAAALSAVSLTSSPVLACATVIRDRQRPGESLEAYEARLTKIERREARRYIRERQSTSLRNANMIFIGREVEVPMPKRNPLPPAEQTDPSTVTITAQRIEVASPRRVYFKPTDWLRGQPSSETFSIGGSLSNCGFRSLGDTSDSQPGDLYLFFARKGPVSEATLIDAIAVDSIDHPALNAFVVKYRKHPVARQ